QPNENITAKGGNSSHLIVFLLGETSYSGRYGSYGYDKNTSPNLDKLAAAENSCLFDKVHSSAPITRDSIAMTLSFETPENIAPLFEETSIIELAREIGYTTYWLSSQTLSGTHDSKYGYLAKGSDILDFTDWEDNRLPDLLERYLDRAIHEDNRAFIVLHMLGSHRPYIEKF